METTHLLQVPEYSGVISTLGDSPAPTVANPGFTGGSMVQMLNSSSFRLGQVSEWSDSLVTEVPEYRGFLFTLGDSPALP